MSIKTWKAEFYPLNAGAVKTDKQAVEQAILKYTGALPRNLKKHNVRLYTGILADDDGYSFSYNTVTCTLCRLHSVDCAVCPLNKYTKHCAITGSFGIFIDTNNVKPMLAALRKALKDVE